MEQTSENRFRSSKKLKIIASTFLVLLTFFSIQTTTVFAEDVDLGGGLSGNENTGAVGNGFRDVDGGYRCYMEDENGRIKQQVVDFYFDGLDGRSDTTPPILEGKACAYGASIAIGGQLASKNKTFAYGDIGELIPGLKPPLYQHSAWGPNLNAWFESESNIEGKNGTSNAELFIVSVFKQSGSDVVDLLYNYKIGKYRIVVEGVYWYNLVNPTGNLIQTASGNTIYVYGTVRDFAKYNSIEQVNNAITNHPERGVGGEWLGRYTNGACATALMLVETDEFSGFGPPTLSPDYGGDRYSYDTILTPKQGWDMHVVYKERASEKW